MRSRAAIRGKFCAPCIPKGASDGRIASSWQDSRAMHPKRAGFGKMCAPCIRKAPQIAVGGYTAQRSCQEGAPFAARAPRIMHDARILPSGVDEAPQRPQPLCRRTTRNSTSRPQPRRRPHGSAHPQHSRCQRQPHRKRSHTPPPRDTEASGGREILRRPSPAAPKRSSGPTAPQHPTAPPGRSIHNGGGATRLDANPDATGATAPTPSAASSARSAKPLAAPRANQQQPSAGLRFVPSKARTHHTYLSATPVAGFSS